MNPYGVILCAASQVRVAEAIQANLDKDIETQIFNQGEMFKIGKSHLANLTESKGKFNFAIIILTPDDLIKGVSNKYFVPRDNVILEIGFFVGILGIERTFIVQEDCENFKLPTYLDGITLARYSKGQSANLRAKLNPVCVQIREAIQNLPISKLSRSKKTPGEHWTNSLVESAFKVVVNALEAPLVDLDVAKLRAFIFKKKGDYLVCSHHWAYIIVKEQVDQLKFEITEITSREVAVVRAAIEKEVVAVAVKPLKKRTREKGKGLDSVDPNLRFVLAAPILGPNGEVWGTVDIDSMSEEGAKLLNQSRAKSVIFELGKHLYLALSSTEQ